MLIRDLMTVSPTCCAPTDTLDVVAGLMVEHACGGIPVCDGNSLVGMITDRDITCRAVARRLDPSAVPVSEIMTRTVYTITDHHRIEDALEMMEKKLVRRLPVLDADGTVVGIVSQADLVLRAPTLRVARALKSLSQKTRKRAAASL